MNIFLLGILRIVLLTGLGLILAGLFGLKFVKREHQPRLRTYLSVGLGVVALFSGLLYINLGFGRELLNERAPLADKYVHYHEQYHFFFGSKYIENVGYDNLYKATYIAAAELEMSSNVTTMRDLQTFALISARDVDLGAATVKGRFSSAEWESFKADLEVFLANRPLNLQGFLNDHGNTGSPVWAVPAHLVTRFLTPSAEVLLVLSFFDLIFLALIGLLVGRAFGLTAGVVTFALATTAPYVGDYLLGSFLRFDWLLALALGFVFAKQKRWTESGIALSYAVFSKLFPIFIVLALTIKFCWAIYQSSRPLQANIDIAHYKNFFKGFFGGAVACLLITAAYFGGFSLWQGYADRTQATLQEKFYLTNNSFRMPFLQIADRGVLGTIDDRFIPPVVSMGKPNVSLQQYGGAWALMLLLVSISYAWVIRRKSDVQAMALGVPLIFFFLVVNPYYYGMVGLFALYWLPEVEKRLRSLVGVIALLGCFAAFYYFQHFGSYYYGGYFMSWLYTALFLSIPVIELFTLWRERALGKSKDVHLPIVQDDTLR